jgi:hypothetical protein
LFENSRNRRGQVGLEKSEFLPTNHRRTNSDGVQCSSRSFPIKQLRGSEILLYPPVLKDDGGVLYAFAHLLSRALVSQSVWERLCVKYSETSNVKQAPFEFIFLCATCLRYYRSTSSVRI